MPSMTNKLEHDPEKILIWDETLRDGEQTPGIFFTVRDKLNLIRALDKLGVDIIDLGFPLTSADEYQIIQQIAHTKEKYQANLGITLRATKQDVEYCKNIDIDHFFLFAPTSKMHIENKMKISESQLLEQSIKAIDYCNELKKDVVFIFEDSARSDLEFLLTFIEKLHDQGINKVILTDTVGVAEPFQFFEQTKEIIDNAPKSFIFGIHCHNDLGMAAANTILSVKAGIRLLTCTVNGIGERAGNAALEEVVVAVEQLFGKKTNINKTLLKHVSEMTEIVSGIPIPPNKAIVGFNAFRHESGIHIDGIKKAPLTYEGVNPEILGLHRQYIYGKHSGKSYFTGSTLTASEKEQLEAIYAEYLLRSKSRKREYIQQTRRYFEENFGLDENKIHEMLRKDNGSKSNQKNLKQVNFGSI